MTALILLVEDDPDLARVLSRALERSGYRVTTAATGSEARSIISEQVHPDLIILDLMLPDTDGLVLTGALKALTSAPIIICSARQEQVDRVLGLKLGADDFVAKPFELEELEARIEAVLRRASRVRGVPADQIQVGELLIWPSRGTVFVAGQAVQLTPTEFHLLVALASRAGEVLSRTMLGQLVWGYEDVGTSHLIDVHVGRLRFKLRQASRSGPAIVTIRGKGYTIR